MAQRSNLAKVIVSVIVILFAVFLLLNMKFHWIPLGFLGGKQNPAEPVIRNVVTIDVLDGKMHLAPLNEKIGEVFPLENPDTHAKTLYQAYVCREEKILFPIRGMVTTCPFCQEKGIRNSSVGAADPNSEEKDYEVKIYEPWRNLFQ
jgi:hypothetical protein